MDGEKKTKIQVPVAQSPTASFTPDIQPVFISPSKNVVQSRTNSTALESNNNKKVPLTRRQEIERKWKWKEVKSQLRVISPNPGVVVDEHDVVGGLELKGDF